MTQIVKRSLSSQLTLTDERLIALSTRLHWRPSTALRRIESALPYTGSKLVYISIAASFRLQPESFAKLMKAYLGHTKLTEEDLSTSSPQYTQFLEFLSAALDLLKVQKTDYPGLSLSIKNAASIVLIYGHDNYDLFFAMIESNLHQIATMAGCSEHSDYSTQMNRAVWYVLRFVFPRNRSLGRCDLLSLHAEDDPSSKSISNRETQDREDTVGMDSTSLKRTATGRNLRDLGVEL